MRKPLVLVLAIAAMSSLAVAETTSTASMADLKAMRFKDVNTTNSAGQPLTAEQQAEMMIRGQQGGNIRNAAMRDAALATASQRGYAQRMSELREQVIRRSIELDRLFDFNTLMRVASEGSNHQYLLPPVIQEAKEIVTSSGARDYMRVSGRVFKIQKPERLVTAPPTWREYLLDELPVSFSVPFDVLLPKTQADRLEWERAIEEGWHSGVAQANDEMRYRVAQLGGDFVGMLRYVRLGLEGKVSEPVVASAHANVIGNGVEMREDETTYRITRAAELDTNMAKWPARILDNRDSLRYPDETVYRQHRVLTPAPIVKDKKS